MSKILNGKIVADKIIKDLSDSIKNLKKQNITPTLAVILVGDNPASKLYVQKKQERIEGLGLCLNLYEFLPIATNDQILELIDKLNKSESIDGILVQLPLPYSFGKNLILQKIDPGKNIDALGENSEFDSPTALSILEILKFYNFSLSQKKVVIVGKGDLVGKPFAEIAKREGADVVLCDRDTRNISEITKTADILVAGTGQANLIKEDMVSKDAIVIDAGVSVENGSQLGDVDFLKVSQKVRAITPPRGGVGPVTIASLIKNLIESAKRRQNS